MYLAVRVDQLIERISMSNHELSQDDIARLVSRYLDQTLKADEAERAQRRGWSQEDAEEQSETLSILADDRKDDLIGGNYGWVTPEAEALLAEDGIKFDPADKSHVVLLRELTKAAAVALKTASRRELGDYSGEASRASSSTPAQQTIDQKSRTSPKLSEAFQAYRTHTQAVRPWTKTTLEKYEGLVGDFVEVVGDRPVHTIDRSLIRQYRELLSRLPARRRVRPLYRGKSVQELLSVEIPPEDRYSVASIGDCLKFFSGMMKFCVREGWMASNPAEGEAPGKKLNESTGYEQWSAEEIRKIMGHRWMTGGAAQDWNFWMPLIGLYSGMRGNEIAQLQARDIVYTDGVWCFDVTDEGEGKQLKTANAKRRVPLHSVLIDLGLLKHAERRRQEGEGARLWSGIRPDRNGKHWSYAGKQFQRMFQALGLSKANAKTFHSFRKCAITGLLNAGVSDILVAELVGHQYGTITVDVYHRGSPTAALKEAIDRLAYDIDFSTLRPPKP